MSPPPRTLRKGKQEEGAAVAIIIISQTTKPRRNGRNAPPLLYVLACVLLLAVESNGDEECYCDRQGHPARRPGHAHWSLSTRACPVHFVFFWLFETFCPTSSLLQSSRVTLVVAVPRVSREKTKKDDNEDATAPLPLPIQFPCPHLESSATRR